MKKFDSEGASTAVVLILIVVGLVIGIALPVVYGAFVGLVGGIVLIILGTIFALTQIYALALPMWIAGVAAEAISFWYIIFSAAWALGA